MEAGLLDFLSLIKSAFNFMDFQLKTWRIFIDPYCITNRFPYLCNEVREFQRSGSLAEKINQGGRIFILVLSDAA
jgi:hypothetical protein